MGNDNFDLLEKALLKSNGILILPHHSIDGDALGASMALALSMLKIGKTAKILPEKEIPESLDFLPGGDRMILKDISSYSYDLCIALDCGDMERFSDRTAYFRNARHTINIDHHHTNPGYAEFNYVDYGKAATCEILYRLIRHMDIQLDADIATCLFLGISADTGGFRYSNTNGDTFRTAAHLADLGADVGKISGRIFEFNNKEHLSLLQIVLQKMELYYDETFAVSTVSLEDFKRIGACDSDMEGIVNYGRKIKTVDVSALLREKEDGSIRVNLRSSGADVSAVASGLNGGGHKNAAGCMLKMPLEEAKKLVIERFSFLKEG